MMRHVSARMSAEVAAGTSIALLIAAHNAAAEHEHLHVSAAGTPWDLTETADRFGNRMHLLHDLPAGVVEISYAARDIAPAVVAEVLASDRPDFLRPSRYCEVDELAPVIDDVLASGSVPATDGFAVIDAVVAWVEGHLSYVPGSSTPRDSARSTYLSREGVCRDYAHLTAALLRAGGVPARCVAVYAPGLSPMDFHLVVEALVDDHWWVVDATRRAPRASMLRIATGLDAADTAFMTTLQGNVVLTGLEVRAVVDPSLPQETHNARVELR